LPAPIEDYPRCNNCGQKLFKQDTYGQFYCPHCNVFYSNNKDKNPEITAALNTVDQETKPTAKPSPPPSDQGKEKPSPRSDPNPSAKSKKELTPKQKGCGIGCLAGIVIFVIIMIIAVASSDNGVDKVSAFVMSQDFVVDRLKSPSTADFPSYRESFVTDIGNGRFQVSAYVDAQNSFGAKMRNRYNCILGSTDGKTWTLENINIFVD